MRLLQLQNRKDLIENPEEEERQGSDQKSALLDPETLGHPEGPGD
jgi:hypothetical protein